MSRSRITVIVFFLALNAVVYYGTYLNLHKHGALPQALSSDMVPDFSWQDFDGKAHNIKELAGHTVVIHFWATWCGPCRSEFPDLLRAAKNLDDVIFLTISADDKLKTAQKFVEKSQEETGTYGLKNVLYAFDPDKKIAFDVFQTAVFPESIVLDPARHMRQKFSGATNWSYAETVEILKSYTHTTPLSSP